MACDDFELGRMPKATRADPQERSAGAATNQAVGTVVESLVTERTDGPEEGTGPAAGDADSATGALHGGERLGQPLREHG